MKRQVREGIMLCYPFELERLEGSSRKAWNQWPVIVQPKLDGWRCRAVFNQRGEVLLFSSTADIVVSVPHIIQQLEQTGLREIELDGELYCHGMDFSTIESRVSRTVNLHPEFHQIEYHIFDLVSPAAQVQRLVKLEQMRDLEKAQNLRIVASELVYGAEEIQTMLDSYCTKGYEGIIVRHPAAPYVRQRSTSIMKFKPGRQDVYRVIGYEEEVSQYGEPKGRLGSLLCQGNDGTTFSVGSGFLAAQREHYWQIRDTLPGQRVLVKYQHVFPGGRPRHSVFAGFITAGVMP